MPREGAQNSKPEDLPVTQSQHLLRAKAGMINFRLIFSYLFPEAVTKKF
jgi:hypothetical protein